MNFFGNEEVHASGNFDVPPHIVFEAWVNPSLMRKWLFVSDTKEIVQVEVDINKNKTYSILTLDNDTHQAVDHYGQYLMVQQPNRLLFSLYVPVHFPGETIVDVLIQPHGDGSILSLVQKGLFKQTAYPDWKKLLEQLALTLENQ